MDAYEGVQSEVLYTMKFDENLEFSTIYLGKQNMSRMDKLKPEEMFPVTEQGLTTGN